MDGRTHPECRKNSFLKTVKNRKAVNRQIQNIQK